MQMVRSVRAPNIYIGRERETGRDGDSFIHASIEYGDIKGIESGSMMK